MKVWVYRWKPSGEIREYDHEQNLYSDWEFIDTYERLIQPPKKTVVKEADLVDIHSCNDEKFFEKKKHLTYCIYSNAKNIKPPTYEIEEGE